MELDRSLRIGIDVGTHSLGVAAIEFEGEEPKQILNAAVFVHDSGIDPDGAKSALTRRQVSGAARRARRRLRERRRRLDELEELFIELGWVEKTKGKSGVSPRKSDPKMADSTVADSLAPWRDRAALATIGIEDETEKRRMLTSAIRHIARHRGWRNPYSRIQSLYRRSTPSQPFFNLVALVQEKGVESASAESTVAQLVEFAGLYPGMRIRDRRSAGEKSKAARAEARSKKKGELVPDREKVLLTERLMQADLANEIHQIAQVQGLSETTTRRIIECVFKCQSPKGSAANRIKEDPLPGQEGLLRATTASIAFQNYRIAATIANVRLNGKRLTSEQKVTIFNLLSQWSKKDPPTWFDVADAIGVTRYEISGCPDKSTSVVDEASVSTAPPFNKVHLTMLTCSVPSVRNWWMQASDGERDALIEELSNQSGSDEVSSEAAATEFLAGLPDEDLDSLQTVRLPSGRAAYSEDSLRRLTTRMLEDEHDLFSARVVEFGVDPEWRPRADEIGEPVGNAAVDRVTKQLARWLGAIEREFGIPDVVHVEHVRSGFASERLSREYQMETRRRAARKEQVADQINLNLGTTGQPPSSADYRKYDAWTRQNCQCAYCGDSLSLKTLQMDHIVARKGIGTNNKRENLVAACERCNREKSNRSLRSWAAQGGVDLDECISRVKMWTNAEGLPPRSWANFKREVIARMKRTDVEEFDGRSIESVAWMANLVADRVQQHFQRISELKMGGKPKTTETTRVRVFNGSVNAGARAACGFVGRANLIGQSEKKTRIDRRHHAMDACVVATLNYSVARTIALRDNIRERELLFGLRETWKEFEGATDGAQREFSVWRSGAQQLAYLFGQAIRNDEVPVVFPRRLSLGRGKAHDDTVHRLRRQSVGSAMSRRLIDNASTPALWCALTRCEDFDSEAGLPENPQRLIVVNGKHLGPEDSIGFFRQVRKKDADDNTEGESDGNLQAAIAVREGFALIGDSIHHSRVFRVTNTTKSGKTKQFLGMVRVYEHDLLRHRNDDLFAVELPPQSITMRCADPRVRKAIEEGTAEYLGWLSVGDELHLDMSQMTTGAVGALCRQFPETTRWIVEGFASPARLRLRPAQIASEGLVGDDDEARNSGRLVVSKEVLGLIGGQGWRPDVNVVFSKCNPRIVRRDSLGNERQTSAAHLPVCWRVPEGQ